MPLIDTNAPKETQTATFAMGCFWCPDYTFGGIKGVVRTRVGYCGGSKENPTYDDLGDHAEAIQIDYDPKVITYERLLSIFWENHEPDRDAFSQQYKCAVFAHDRKQKQQAAASRDQIAERLAVEIATEVLPAAKFYVAEDYHQKYELRHRSELMKEFAAMYPAEKDFVNPTAAARVNSIVGGHAEPELVKAEIETYGLSAEAQEKLLELLPTRD